MCTKQGVMPVCTDDVQAGIRFMPPRTAGHVCRACLISLIGRTVRRACPRDFGGVRAVVPKIRNTTQHGAIGENRLTCETAAGRLAVRRKNSNFASVVVVAPTDGHTVRPGLTLFSRGRILTAGQNLKKADQP